eukprot:gene6260-22873_t
MATQMPEFCVGDVAPDVADRGRGDFGACSSGPQNGERCYAYAY